MFDASQPTTVHELGYSAELIIQVVLRAVSLGSSRITNHAAAFWFGEPINRRTGRVHINFGAITELRPGGTRLATSQLVANAPSSEKRAPNLICAPRVGAVGKMVKPMYNRAWLIRVGKRQAVVE